VGSGVQGADNTALVFIDAETRNTRKGVNKVEGRKKGRNVVGSKGEIVSEGIGVDGSGV
jgi:hypothetical protein